MLRDGRGVWLTAQTARSGSVLTVLAPAAAFRGESAFWLGLLGTGAALFKLVAAAGLWTLQPWGWRLALVGGTLKLMTHLVAVRRNAITPAGIVGALVNVAVLVYLLRHTCAGALGRPGRRPDHVTGDGESGTYGIGLGARVGRDPRRESLTNRLLAVHLTTS